MKRGSAKSRGFTLVELLVVVGIITILLAILLPVITRAREQGNRASCASNLRQLGVAMQTYCNNNNGERPRTLHLAADPAAVWTVGTGKTNNSPDAFPPPPPAVNGAPTANDASSAIFLLLRTQELPASMFICPSSSMATADTFGTPIVAGVLKKATDVSNFGAGKSGPAWKFSLFCGYSMQNPYPGTLNKKFRWDDTLGADVPIMADINPGLVTVGSPKIRDDAAAADPTSTATDATMLKANSNNHKKAGQNVLYADGHVKWCSDARAGISGDNIYTAKAPGTTLVKAAPVDEKDAILVPSDDE